jgi:hypothetical protein
VPERRVSPRIEVELRRYGGRMDIWDLLSAHFDLSLPATITSLFAEGFSR